MTRTTRLLAGLLATLVTAVPAGVYAVSPKSEATPAPAAVAEKRVATSSKPSATTASMPSPRNTAAKATTKQADSGAKTATAVKKTPSPKTARAANKTTTSKNTPTANTAAQAKTRAAKRSTGTAAKASSGSSGVTAAAVRSSGLLTEEGTGSGEALCYRRAAGRGRCEPQCLPYTRCRSGIDSCRTGHENGPVTWFQCEQSRGNTSLEPGDGTILVLGRNKHNMPTGHTLYVEKAAPRGDGRYDLVLSHTNYDRRCNLETNIAAVYDKDAKTIDVHTGNWAAWGRDLKVAGFIVN